MAHDPVQQSDELRAAKASRTKSRGWLFATGCVVGLLFMFLLMLPTLISTVPGTRLVLGVLNRQILGTIDVDRLQVSWFGAQRIEGLRLRDSQNVDIVSVKQIAAPDMSLVSAALGSGRYGHVTLTNMVARVERFKDGTTSVQRAFASTTGTQPVRPEPAGDGGQPGTRIGPRGLSLSIEVVEAQVTYQAHDQLPIVANIPTAVVDLSDMRQIRVKVNGAVTRQGQTGQLDVDALIENLFDAKGIATIDRAQINAAAKLQEVPVGALDALADQGGLLVALLGPLADGDLELKGDLSNLEAKLDATSQHLSVRAHVVGHDGRVSMQEPSPFQWTITPAAWSVLASRYPALAGTALQEAIDIRAAVEQLVIPLDDQRRPMVHRAAVKADVSVGDLLVDASEPLGRIGIRDTNLSFASETIGSDVSLTGRSVVAQGSHSGGVSVDVSVDDLLDKTGRLNVSGLSISAVVELSDLPAAMVEQFAPAAKGVTQVVGPTLGAKLDAHLKPVPGAAAMAGPVTLIAKSEHLSAHVNLVVREDLAITQRMDEVSWIELMVTPQALDQLLDEVAPDGRKQIELVHPSRLHLSVDDAVIVLWPAKKRPKPGSTPIDLANSKLIATLTADTKALRFPQAQGVTGQFKQIRIKINAQRPSQQVNLDAEVTIDDSVAGGSDLQPTFVSTNRISGLIDADGAVSLRAAAIESTIRVSEFPTSLLDVLVGGNGQLFAMMGQFTTFMLEAEGSVGQQGTVKLSLDSENARASVKGTVDRQGRLSLTEDLKAALTVTPELGQQYLAALNPLLTDVRSSSRPIELTVSKEDFVASLNKLDLAGLKMKGQLKIGTLTMQQGDLGRALVESLRAAGSPIQSRQRFDATFTKLRFSISDGVIRSNDLWMDTGDLLLGTQARVYVTGEPDDFHADVLMGIPGETVRLIPKVVKRIRPEAIYELPVSGPLDKLEPDVAALLTQILAEAALGEAGGLAIAIGQAIFNKPNQTADTDAVDDAWRNAKWENRPSASRRVTETVEAAESDPEPGKPEPLDLLGEVLRGAIKK